ncbi:MAG: universal stress protein [Chloroflexota bacterium]
MYKKVIVPLDGSELAECVLPHVEAIAGGCGVAEVVLVRVIEPVHLPVGTMTDGADVFTEADAERVRKRQDKVDKTEALDYLTGVAKRLELGRARKQTQVIMGHAADMLVDFTKGSGADLVVIASHGRSGISRWVFGSVAERLVRGACVPVLMVRAPGCEIGI